MHPRLQLEWNAWTATLPEYRTTMFGGDRAILCMDRKTGATVLAPLYTLSDDELRNVIAGRNP
jgi:hypothetical protein